MPRPENTLHTPVNPPPPHFSCTGTDTKILARTTPPPEDLRAGQFPFRVSPPFDWKAPESVYRYLSETECNEPRHRPGPAIPLPSRRRGAASEGARALGE